MQQYRRFLKLLGVERDEIVEFDTEAVGDADERAEPRIARSPLDLAKPRAIHTEHGGELLLGESCGVTIPRDLSAQLLFYNEFIHRLSI